MEAPREFQWVLQSIAAADGDPMNDISELVRLGIYMLAASALTKKKVFAGGFANEIYRSPRFKAVPNSQRKEALAHLIGRAAMGFPPRDDGEALVRKVLFRAIFEDGFTLEPKRRRRGAPKKNIGALAAELMAQQPAGIKRTAAYEDIAHRLHKHPDHIRKVIRGLKRGLPRGGTKVSGQ